MESFKERLNYVLNGRKLFPWVATLGVSKGCAEYMSKGNAPGSEILSIIAKKENLNISWFLNGNGSPYQTTNTLSESDYIKILKQRFEEKQDWDVILHHSDNLLATTLVTESVFTYKGSRHKFQQYELIVGSMGCKVLEFLQSILKSLEGEMFVKQPVWQICTLSDDLLKRIAYGMIGGNRLYGDGKKTKPLWSLKNIQSVNDLPSIEMYEISDIKIPVSTRLMREIISSTELIAEDNGITLTTASRSKTYTAMYRYVQKAKSDEKAIDTDQILTLLEVLAE